MGTDGIDPASSEGGNGDEEFLFIVFGGTYDRDFLVRYRRVGVDCGIRASTVGGTWDWEGLSCRTIVGSNFNRNFKLHLRIATASDSLPSCSEAVSRDRKNRRVVDLNGSIVEYFHPNRTGY